MIVCEHRVKELLMSAYEANACVGAESGAAWAVTRAQRMST